MKALFVFVVVILASSASAQVLKKEPANDGGLSLGQIVLVDDGTCPKGKIKEVVGGSQKRGVKRIRRCVRRR